MRSSLGEFVLQYFAWLILVGTVVFASMAVPRFLTTRNLVNILYHSSILGMLVLPQSLCLLSGNLDLSIESTIAVSVAIPVVIMMRTQAAFPSPILIPLSLAVGLAIGLVNGFFVVKMGINSFLMTLAMMIMLRGMMLFLVPRTIYGLPASFTFVGGSPILGVPLPVFILIAVYALFFFVLRYTRFGREVYATGGNKAAAYAAGIDSERVTMIVFMLSGLLAAIGGWIIAGRLEAVTNNMGEGMVFLAFAGAVIGGVSLRGGIGTVLGAFSGLLLLGVIDNVLSLSQVSPYLVYALKGFMIFVAMNIDSLKQRLI
jgi:simple sugar transport system permease protein/ribose transport system permease protein